MHLVRFDVAAPEQKNETNNIHYFDQTTLPYLFSFSANFSSKNTSVIHALMNTETPRCVPNNESLCCMLP